MKTCLSIRLQNPEIGKILHITDTHLFAKASNTLLGVSTNASFKAVINQLFYNQAQDFDLIVATGDFVQDGSEKAYEYFSETMNKLNFPCAYIPGNHDKFSLMKKVFTKGGLIDNKIILLGSKWVLLFLNSQVPDKAYGLLDESELAFLDSALRAHSDRNALIFLHHHPVKINSKWLDEHYLKNSDEFAAIITQHANVKSIGCGHIHQQLDTLWHGCQVFATPSTCFQFKPLSDEFRLDTVTPGWRIIELKHKEDKIHSTVHRLSKNLFLPDMSQNGY